MFYLGGMFALYSLGMVSQKCAAAAVVSCCRSEQQARPSLSPSLIILTSYRNFDVYYSTVRFASVTVRNLTKPWSQLPSFMRHLSLSVRKTSQTAVSCFV